MTLLTSKPAVPPSGGGSAAAPDNILHVFARSVAAAPRDKVFARWYNGNGKVEDVRTYHGIWTQSGEIAHSLRVEWGFGKGDRVVLAYNFGLRFLVTFLGCLRAGVIAVPVYPPNPATLKKSLRKLQLIVDSCEPKMILVCPEVNKLRQASKLRAVATGNSEWPDLPYKCPEVKQEGATSSPLWAFAERLGGVAGGSQTKSFDEPSILPDDVAFLQFTSGSTSDPKGVMLTYGNLSHNIGLVLGIEEEEIAARGIGPERRVWFSWLPTFHDMGLIQGTLLPFAAGWTAAYCSPITFIRSPLIWLQLMSKEKAQMTAAPDFAFGLCTRKWNEMTPEARASLNLDLSHLVFMQNAAEPVRTSTVREFVATFAECGLSGFTVTASYGLAEHTVGVCSFSPNRSGASLESITDERLRICGNLAVTAKYGVEAKIVDPETCRELSEGETGELWLSSPSVGSGYWGKPELSRESFEARIDHSNGEGSGVKFLRTGDLCRIDAAGFIYVEGRLKDLIIVSGRNIYPQDVEFAAQEASPLVRPGCVAAFSETELGGNLEVVLEVRGAAGKDQRRVLAALEAVRRAVMGVAGQDPSRVVAIKERTIPKTTSGKIQRRLTRTRLHAGQLTVVMDLVHVTETPAATLPPPAAHESQWNTARESEEETKDFVRIEKMAQKNTAPSVNVSLDGEDDRLVEEAVGEAAGPTLMGTSPEVGAAPTDISANFTRTPCSPPTLDAQAVVRIVEEVTGLEGTTVSDDLLDLGVDSATSVELSAHLSEACGHELPSELIFSHPTATAIANFVASLGQPKNRGTGDGKLVSNQGVDPRKDSCTTARSHDDDDGSSPAVTYWKQHAARWTTGPMREWRFRLMQALLLLLVILQLFVCMVPARHLLAWIDDLAQGDFGGKDKQPWLLVELPRGGQGKSSTLGRGLLTALVPVTWFVTFTALVVVVKWTVLGKISQGRILLSTPAYLAWWYVNATCNVWENIGGWWLLDTQLLVLFYRVMGARISWGARIHVFVRDWDLVRIGDGASIDGALYTRRFEASSMVVLPVVVGKGASIGSGAVIYGGTEMGDFSSVRPLGVVAPRSRLPNDSVWEGHPAKQILAKGSDWPAASSSDASISRWSLLGLELAKVVITLVTLGVIVVTTYFPAWVFASFELPGSFRYKSLLQVVVIIGGGVMSLALFTVMMKWLLAGFITEGVYDVNALTVLRRWYLGRLHSAANNYFLVFNRFRVYDWWSASLGMKVGTGAHLLCDGRYNPEDAHLIKVGARSLMSYPFLTVDHSIGSRGEDRDSGQQREKKPVTVGAAAVVGFRAHLGPGSTVGDRSMMAPFSCLRSGESLPPGASTMSDLDAKFFSSQTNHPHGAQKKACGLPTDAAEPGARGGLSERDKLYCVLIDAACTLGLWLVNAVAWICTNEVTRALWAVEWMQKRPDIRLVLAGTVGVVVWAVLVAVLVVPYKWITIGNEREMGEDFGSAAGEHRAQNGHPRSPQPMEEGRNRGALNRSDAAKRLSATQVMRWRCLRRALNATLFEPYVLFPLLQGTWLYNLWLVAMGADVSMGALILDFVNDHDMVQVCDGAVVAGDVSGHRVVVQDGQLAMRTHPAMIGARAVVHAHFACCWSGNLHEGAVLTAASATVGGQVLKAATVYGGRPPKAMQGSWIAGPVVT